MVRRSLATFLSAAFGAGLLMAMPMGCADVPASEDVGTDDDALSSCGNPTEIFLWSSRDSLIPVLQGLTPDVACTQYYVVLPLAADDKTQFHANVKQEIDRVHSYGKNFHAVAEFNFGAWSKQKGAGTWASMARTFRRSMETAGFDIHPGSSDTWLIQELPSTLLSSKNGIDKDQVRANVVEITKTLATAGAKGPKMGAIVHVGMPQVEDNPASIPAHKQNLEDLILDASFWNGIKPYVRFWGEEVYADAHAVCPDDAKTTVAERSSRVSTYAYHLPRLAAAGPAGAEAARQFLSRTYVPWFNAAWNADVGYGDNRIPAPVMQDLISLQIYAARAWQGAHKVPGASHLAFAWVPLASTAREINEANAQADRLATALSDVYAKDQGASFACSDSGAYTHCACRLPNQRMSAADPWATFNTW